MATIAVSLPAFAAVAPVSPAYTWKSVTVGAGGFVPGIVFSPVEKGLAYLRSDMGGAYRWDKSAKQWLPLQDGMSESSYFGIESIAPDPIDPNVVYIAAGMYRGDASAMLRSQDKGKTWKTYPVDFRMGGNEDGRGLGERLAVDPNSHNILYFGSRHDGLQKSVDFGATWQKVASFPLAGLGLPERGPTHAGLSFVVFDSRSGKRGTATQTLFVASADPGPQHLFRSDDAGLTWMPIKGGPSSDLLPVKGEIDAAGTLYMTFCNGMGPNGVTAGAVMKLDTGTNQWTDITPDKSADRPAGGYMGLSLDHQKPGTLGVTTMNRWNPGDTVWRSTDGGKTWADILGKSRRDVAATPYLLWGQKEARLGWWMAAFAIDPFDSNFAAYGTGATIYATREFSQVNSTVNAKATTLWSPWVSGIEQTAVITLMSPKVGAPLVSGFGDIGGFVHTDVDQSPPQGMFQNPTFDNTNVLDYAGSNPSFIVRSGRPRDNEASLSFSRDGGHIWQPLYLPPAPLESVTANRNGARRESLTPSLIVSADGRSLMAMTRTPQLSRDFGATWVPVQGLPSGGRPVADRVDAQRFYALDFENNLIYTSKDGGLTFTPSPVKGLPVELVADKPNWSEAAWPLQATPDQKGDLWFVSRQGLFHSVDGGLNFEMCPHDIQVEALSFGKAPDGQTYPALFALGRQGATRAIWRSDDRGLNWQRINDENHQWGTRFRCISGDPKIFGRVYIGTDGRGILYGEPSAPTRYTMATQRGR